jgi:hypothetical protein
MPRLRPYVLLGLIAWVSGVIAYTAALALVWNEGSAVAEVLGLAISSLMVFAAVYAFIYLPVLLWLRRRLAGSLHVWLLPLASLPLSIVGVAFVWLSVSVPAALLGFEVSLSSAPAFFISPEASLYYWLFGVAGVVIAVGIAILHSREAAI